MSYSSLKEKNLTAANKYFLDVITLLNAWSTNDVTIDSINKKKKLENAFENAVIWGAKAEYRRDSMKFINSLMNEGFRLLNEL